MRIAGIARELDDVVEIVTERDGTAAVAFTDRHPDGATIALELYAGADHKAGIWDLRTGTCRWSRPDAVAIRWSASGGRAVVLRHADGVHLDVLAWPDCRLVGSAPVRYLTGWTHGLVVVGEDLAVAVYNEQDGCGYVLIDLEPAVRQRDKAFWFGGPQGGLVGPVVSPDHQLLVSAMAAGHGWWMPFDDDDPTHEDDDALETPSDGGSKLAGSLHVHRLATGEVIERAIYIDLPAGWLPDERATGLDADRFHDITFTGRHEVSLLLPTGERRTIII